VIHAFIRQHESEFPAAMACRALGVSRSGYQASLVRTESERSKADRALTALIAESHQASRQTYGAPRVRDDLCEQGHRVGQRRVARLVRRAGLRGVSHPRKAAHVGLPATVEGPDLVRREFTAEAPDRVWCADVKQVWTREGWVFLAAVIDLYSRRIVGHACGTSATTELVERAFAGAVQHRRPSPGLVHHSDPYIIRIVARRTSRVRCCRRWLRPGPCGA
jgi:putative transposase